jgi:hypothetical protein
MSGIAPDEPDSPGGSPEGGPGESRGAAPVKPEMPRKLQASFSEGVPDLTTASAAGDLPAVEPSVTQASPDVPELEKPAPGLAGADLQPVEDRDAPGGGPREPVPRATPAGSSEPEPS